MPDLSAVVSERWLWLGSSMLLAILWSTLAWFFRHPRPGRVGDFVTRLVAQPYAQWLLQVLRLLYYIGVPFAALTWRGSVSESMLGLSSGQRDPWIDWASDIGWAVTLGVGTWVVLGLAWLAYRRATASGGQTGTVAGTSGSGWVFLREAAYHEIHWAFYRNAPSIALNGDAYWGAWLGLLFVAVEALLNPAWRQGLADPEKAPFQLMRGALAVVSTVFPLVTANGNLWLACALHLCVSWGLAALMRALPPATVHKPDQAGA